MAKSDRAEMVRAMCQSSLQDLPQEGILGLAAMTSCVRSLERIEGLTSDNTAEVLKDLAEIKQELDMLDRALKAGQAGLTTAMGRVQDVVDAAIAILEEPAAE